MDRAEQILTLLSAVTVAVVIITIATMAGKEPQRGFTFSRCIELGNQPSECI